MVELISIHMPKTAGTSFRTILQQVYGLHQVWLDYDPFELPNVAAIERSRVLHGHFAACKYPQWHGTDWIVWLRHPLQRLLSHYFFQQWQSAVHGQHEIAALSLVEFASHPGIRDLMSQYLADRSLSDFKFVGVQEYFATDVVDLADCLGWETFDLPAENANPADGYQLQVEKTLQDKGLMQALLEINQADMALYEQALDLRSQRRSRSQMSMPLRLFRQREAIGLDTLPRAGVPSSRLDRAAAEVPGAQAALNLFAGEWVSQLPEPYSELQAGPLPLFNDDRIAWLIEQLGSVAGQRVLELGPLEGGQAYMLEQAGAAAIVAIETDPRSYLKCLIVKEILQMQRSQFSCGNFLSYLQDSAETFDLALVSNVLHHLKNPAELISLLSHKADRLYLWTHYADADLLATAPDPSGLRDRSGTLVSYHGFQHRLYRQDVHSPLGWLGFCGGSGHSYWFDRAGLLGCLQYFGYGQITIGYDQPDHPNGPALAILATRT